MFSYMKLALAAGVIALSCYGTWYATSDHYEKLAAQVEVENGKEVAAQQATVILLMAADAAQRTEARVQHAKDQLVLNALAARNNSMHVSFAGSCGGVQAGSKEGSDTGGGGGVLHESVDSLFADLQRRTDAIILRCDQLNNDAIERNNESK